MLFLLLRTTIAMLIAFGGGVLGISLSKMAPHRLSLLVYAAMGALLAVTAFDILPDAKALLSWPLFLLATASGYGLFWALGKYVYHICPACSIAAFDKATTERLGQSVLLLMAALSLHSAMDGIAVVVGDRVAGHPDLTLLFAVSFHKLPEGLALSLLLLGAGYSRRAALLWTFAIESTTEIGALVGVLSLRHISLFHLGLVFAHVGGGFIYLIVTTLGLFSQSKSRHSASPLVLPLVASSSAAFALTASLMLLLRRFTL
jgi:zinc transporter ZupT